MSNEALGYDDVELQIGDGASPQVFARACSVQGFDGPTKSRSAYETSTLCDQAATYKAGILKNGTVTMNLIREKDADDYAALDAAIESADFITVRIVDKTATPDAYIEFQALVTELKTFGVAIDQAVTASATLQVSGSISEGSL